MVKLCRAPRVHVLVVDVRASLRTFEVRAALIWAFRCVIHGSDGDFPPGVRPYLPQVLGGPAFLLIRRLLGRRENNELKM